MLGLSGRAFRAFCGTLLLGVGFLVVAGIAMIFDQVRPLHGMTEVILRVGLFGFCMLSAIAFVIPAAVAASGLRRGARKPGARSTLVSSSGFALTAATLGVLSAVMPASATPGPSPVPNVLIGTLVISVCIWFAGMFVRDPEA